MIDNVGITMINHPLNHHKIVGINHSQMSGLLLLFPHYRVEIYGQNGCQTFTTHMAAILATETSLSMAFFFVLFACSYVLCVEDCFTCNMS